MTSLTMQNSWTAPTMLSRWAESAPERTWSSEPTFERVKTVGRVSAWVGTVDTAVRMLTPVVVAGGVMFAALMWPSPAHADPVGPNLNAPGPVAAQADPVKSAIAEFGQSLCPMLVQPGSTLATNASQMQGNGGLTSSIAGVATGMAIQMECPAVMAQLADGNPSTLLDLMGANSTPASALRLPGL